MDLDGGVGLALRTLASAHGSTLTPKQVGVATVDTESERFTEFTTSEIETYLTEPDLGNDDSTETTDGRGE